MPEIGEIRRGKEIGKTSSRYIWATCADCGKERWTACKNGRAIAIRCHACNNKYLFSTQQGGGHRHKGGGKRHHGYIRIKLYPNDFFYPMATTDGYVLGHRLVVAKALGRCLQPWEIVHHKEGFAKDDNRYPKTLQLVMEGQHNQITIMENRIKQLEARVTLLEAENILLRKEAKEVFSG